MDNSIIIDAIWLSVAFVMGLLAKKVNLPSLIGFLLTGIILNVFNLSQGNISELLKTLSDLGIMLLLFTIGLKIKIKSILKKEVVFTSSIHASISTVFIGTIVFALSYLFSSFLGNLSLEASLLIGFGLSFSSTVFVVKILEERGELNSYHGKIAIGILVIQDIFAVLFLTFSSNQLPNLYALFLPLYLYVIRYILSYILSHSGHGELLTFFGFFATFVCGALVFYFVGIKPDLGALIAGMLLVNHKKADELYDRMMNYKDFFLIAFFINIGLIGIPTLRDFAIALILLPLIFLKGTFFIVLLSNFKIRARTAFLTSLSLSNYSEFALIIGMVGFNLGIINKDWIMVFAILMTLSFLIASPLNAYAHQIFDKYRNLIMKLNTGKKYVDEEPKSIEDAEYIIIGFGSIGKPAYNYLTQRLNQKVVAIDYNHEVVKKYKHQGINILWGDTTNSIFWDNINFSNVKIVLLAMSDFNSNINSLNEILKIKNRTFKVAATCSYIDEAKILREKYVDYVYDYKLYLGSDFAEQTFEKYTHSVIHSKINFTERDID